MALARTAGSTGDAIEIENFFQHAEHYFRQMKELEGVVRSIQPDPAGTNDEALHAAG